VGGWVGGRGARRRGARCAPPERGVAATPRCSEERWGAALGSAAALFKSLKIPC
jgi:hypothetical protein